MLLRRSLFLSLAAVLHYGLRLVSLAAISGIFGAPVIANEDVQSAHWAYSAIFGTGWYRIADNRAVFVLRIPPRQTLRASSISATGERTLGIELHYPVTLGLHNIDEIPEIADSNNFGTISFTPGIEFEVPVSKAFYLRPFAHFGWGKNLEDDDDAWIYYAGIKSRYTFSKGGLDWGLLGSLYYAGYNPDIGTSNDIAALLVGVEFSKQLNSSLFDHDLDLRTHLTYSTLNQELEYFDESGSRGVDDVVEIGIAFSYRGDPINLGLFRVEQIGLAYEASPEGDYSAIKFNLRSWFTR